MRSTNVILASSTPFTGNTAAFSSSATNQGTHSSSATFFGYSGGATKLPYGIGIALQANLGTSNPNQSNMGGTLSLLGSNTNEANNFVVQSSAFLNSTSGAIMLKDSSPWYQWVDFRFLPQSTMGSSAGFVTVILSVKGNS